MKSQTLRLLPRLCLALLSFVLSISVVYTIAEPYFFDLIIYQKSLLHGYGRMIEDYMPFYGRRSRDLRELARRQTIERTDGTVPEKTAVAKPFTVAVIGDSYVWGRGLTNGNLVTVQLEKLLRKIKPTEILTFGYPGDNILDYLKRYREIERLFSVDLYVFMLSPNDMYAPENNPYHEEILNHCREQYPGEPILYPADGDTNQNLSRGNICITEEAFRRLPTARARYFIMSFRKAPDIVDQAMTQILARQSKTIVTARDNPKYRVYWETPGRYFYISSHETHASKLAHRMMAEVLFDNIIRDPSFQENRKQ